MAKRAFTSSLTVHACAVILIATASIAEAQARSKFDLPPQPLADSLRAVGSQANINVLFDPPLVADHQAPALKGEYTSSQAFTLLLVGTRITHEFMNDHTVVLAPATATSGGESSGTADRRSPRSGNEETSENVSFSSLADSARSQHGAAQSEDQGFWQRFRLAQAQSAASSSSSGLSRDDSTSTATLEEVVVTAQKREERLQDVPISIAVLSGDSLDRSTSAGLAEVLQRVPGVSILTSHVGGGSQFPIRGVVSGGAIFQGSSPTAYYLDTVPFGFSKTAIGPDPDVYDLERIEVLRGPQGTLYGSSALNGVVRILTHRADPAKLEAKARSAVSSTKDGGANYRADMALNVPVVEDKVAARAVVGYQDLSGWIEGPIKKNINDAERLNARLRVDATPTDRLSLGALVWMSRSDYGAPSGANDFGLRRTTLDEPIWTDYNVYGFSASYDFESIVLNSSTSYIDYENHWHLDARPGSGLFLYDGRLLAETFSQEVTLASSGEGPWRWTAGGIYRDSEDTLDYFIANSSRAQSIDTRKTESFAVFGEITRLLLDGQLEITGGLRYFEDKLTQEEISRANGATNPPLSRKSGTFTATTPRVVLSWHTTQHMTAYASYGQGFRSGVFQSPGALIVDATLPDARPDRLHNYEVGTKASMFDGRINFDVAAFYIDWQDIQQPVSIRSPVTQTTVSALVNGTSVSGAGAEFSVTAEATRSLSLGMSFSWNDLTYDTAVTSVTASGALLLYDKGDRIAFSPEYTAGASLDYSFSVGALDGMISLAGNYTSAEGHSEIVSGRVVSFKSDAITTARASASLSSDNGWTATLFAENLANEKGSSLRQDTDYWAARIRPQTIGVQLEYRY